MNDLSQVSDRELVLEIYRRIKGEDEMSEFRNYCYLNPTRKPDDDPV